MPLPAFTRALPPRPPLMLQPLGGLLVVSGPPLGGKGPLAAGLHDQLPGSVKLEMADTLDAGAPNGSRAGATGEGALLQEARRCLAPGLGRVAPVVILCARFSGPRVRSQAARVSRELRVRFLLVEATSSTFRSLRRLSRLLLSAEEAAARLERFRLEAGAYVRVSAAELKRLPALALDHVLGDLEGATARVLEAWLRAGA